MNTIGDYIVTSKIGSGSFAIVYKGYLKSDPSKTVAIKAILRDRLNGKLTENLESEISIMQQMDHKHIVRLYEIKKTSKHIYLILEYCAGGDLHKWIKQHALSETESKHWFLQLAKGIGVLYQNNMIHRDLKPQNLLLSSNDPNTAVLKIADFGFARHLASASMAETLCGSPLYMAPEILKFQKYDAKADLWSIGTILYEMIVGKPPFNGHNHIQLLANIEHNPVRIPDSVRISDECKHLIMHLLKRDPILRISFDEFFAHPFVEMKAQRKVKHNSEQVEQPNAFESELICSTSKLSNKTESNFEMYSLDRSNVASAPCSAPTPRTNPFKQLQNSPPLAQKPPLSATITPRREDVMPLTRRHTVNPANTAPLEKSSEFVIVSSENFSSPVQTSSAMQQPNVNDNSQTMNALIFHEQFNHIEELVGYLHVLLQRMDATTKLADRIYALSNGKHSLDDLPTQKAFMLYIRAARIGQHVHSVALKTTTNLTQDSGSYEPTLQHLILDSTGRLQSCVDFLEQCQKLTQSDTIVSMCDELLYYEALNIGKDAGIQEFIGNVSNCMQAYLDAKLLLETMLLSSLVQSRIGKFDLEIVSYYIKGFEYRIQVLSESD